MEGFKLKYWEFIEKLLKTSPANLRLYNYNNDYLCQLFSSSSHISLIYIRRKKYFRWHWDLISKNPAIKLKDIKKNLDLPRNYYYLIQNPNLTWEFIYSNLEIFRKYDPILEKVTIHPSVTMDIINKHPEIEWCYKKIIYNPNIDFENYNKFKFAFGDLEKHREILSKSKNLPIQTILDNPDFKWDFYSIILNPNLVADYLEPILKLYKSQNKMCYFSWEYLSQSPFITMDMIEKYPDFPWKPYLLTKNPNLTCEFVKRNYYKYFKNQKDIIFYWKSISKHHNIKLIDIEENLRDYPWHWGGLSENPNITWEFVNKHKSESWNWSMLSSVIDCDIIDKNSIYRWNTYQFYKNKTLSWDFILKNKDLIWNWRYIFLEQDFTKEKKKFIAKHLFDKWNGKRIKRKLIEARECMLWWEHPDNKITIKLRENLWKSGISIYDVYGNS